MSVPNNRVQMERRLKSLKNKKDVSNCKRQFPDCPTEKNDDCKKCPYYRK